MIKQITKTFLFDLAEILLAHMLIWGLLLIYSDYIILVSVLALFSVLIGIWSWRKGRQRGIISLLINPFSFYILLSFSIGTFNTCTFRPELTFVSYDSSKGPFAQRDLELSRRDIDPEMGVFDYMFSVPHNATVRFYMSFVGKVDHRFVLFYRDELPQGLYLP